MTAPREETKSPIQVIDRMMRLLEKATSSGAAPHGVAVLNTTASGTA